MDLRVDLRILFRISPKIRSTKVNRLQELSNARSLLSRKLDFPELFSLTYVR